MFWNSGKRNCLCSFDFCNFEQRLTLVRFLRILLTIYDVLWLIELKLDFLNKLQTDYKDNVIKVYTVKLWNQACLWIWLFECKAPKSCLIWTMLNFRTKKQPQLPTEYHTSSVKFLVPNTTFKTDFKKFQGKSLTY